MKHMPVLSTVFNTERAEGVTNGTTNAIGLPTEWWLIQPYTRKFCRSAIAEVMRDVAHTAGGARCKSLIYVFSFNTCGMWHRST